MTDLLGSGSWRYSRKGCLDRQLTIEICSSVITAAAHRVYRPDGSVSEDDIDNFGWSEMPETLTWLRAEHRKLVDLGWALSSTDGIATQIDIVPPVPVPMNIAPARGGSPLPFLP